MSDEEIEEDSIGSLQVPLLPKRRKTTSFTRCIICQLDKKDGLRKGKQSSIDNLVSKLKIRGPDNEVYQRLLPFFDELHENEVLWHASCYASYTSTQNVKHASKSREENVRDDQEVADDSFVRVSRSKVDEHDWSKCLFCKNRTYKKEKTMINLSTFKACITIRQCAEARSDQDMVHILTSANDDLVAAGAKYHKTCYANYVSKVNLHLQSSREEGGKSSVYDEAFHELTKNIEKGLESGRAYDMSSLLKKYAELLEIRGASDQKYTKQKLKLRLKAHFGEKIVFHQPWQKTCPELIYSSNISLQEVINASAAHSSESSTERQRKPKGSYSEEEQSLVYTLYKAAKSLKNEIKKSEGISLYPTSINDINLRRAKQVLPRSLYLFIRWIITNDDFNIDFESKCKNDPDERKVLSLAQDITHCSSHGRVKLPKHVGLAMCVRHLTGSKQMVSILNRMGHCSSYEEIESVDTGLAMEILAQSEQHGAVIPSNISQGTFIQFAADNNDINEETLDGKNTTHATTLVVYQKKTHGPVLPSGVFADHSKKKRSLHMSNNGEEILECSAHGRRPVVKSFLGRLTDLAHFHVTDSAHSLMRRMDLTWALARLSPRTLFTEGGHFGTEPAHQLVPSWSGFNSVLFPETAESTVIGYCPMINGSSTEFSTIYTVMKRAQSMCARLQQSEVVITFDLAVYVKAKQIQWKYPEEFSDTVIRMGGFHIALNFLSVIGKRYLNSGLEDVLIESGAYASGSVTCLMKGKSYNRGVRAHKLAMEALFRLMWQAFIHWLNSDSQEAVRSSIQMNCITNLTESLHLALKEKKPVQEKAETIVSELDPVLQLFESFRQDKSQSQMFAFWNEYVNMVMTLLNFIKAERTGNWPLHLETATAMLPYFYAHDRPNYARWLPVYLADMAQLEEKHPEVHARFMDGDHAVSRSNQAFSKVWTDMALEQSVNLDSKSKGGIVGISQNPEALQRWFLTSHERAAITTAVKEMCGINDPDRIGTHKEAGPKRVQRDENDVQHIVNCFTSGLMKDPFYEYDALSNIATGVVLPDALAKRLVGSKDEGEKLLDSFIKHRLNSNDVSFWDPLPKLKIKTFSDTTKKVKTASSNEKLITVAEDRDLFGRLLIVAKARQVNLKDVLSFELSSVPYSLAYTDGTLRKTVKSSFLQILESGVSVEQRLPHPLSLSTVFIIDGMALIQMLKFAGATTFGGMAMKYYNTITSYLHEINCHRVDVIFDQYWDVSIKAGERKKRGEASALEVTIHGESMPVPKQWPKYISNIKNKVSLCAFLTNAWTKAGQHLPHNKELVIGGGMRNGEIALSVKNGRCVAVPDLNSDHEEADTRMLLHAKHAKQDAERIVIQSPDTDVLILCVSHYDDIGCKELWFRTGVKDHLRYIPAHKISQTLGRRLCKALPAFHALTGCDSTSAFAGLGKKKAWKVITESNAHQQTLGNVGLLAEVDEDTARNIEAFICSLFTVSKRIPTSVDEARYILFCQKAQNNMALPPTSDSLLQHSKRANYQAHVWRNALVARQGLPSPENHGWKFEEGILCPELMTKPPAPECILELTNCKCQKSMCTKNCSCRNNGLACTEACMCMAEEEHCQNLSNSYCDDDDEDTDISDDSDEDSEMAESDFSD